MRNQALNVEDTHQEIKKISRQIMSLSDQCKRSPGDSYSEMHQKRKIRGALDNAVHFLNVTKRILHNEPRKEARAPHLSKAALYQLVQSGKTLPEITSYFEVDKGVIVRTMRMFGISSPNPNFGGS